MDCKGNLYEVGDSKETVPIESISKVFALAKLMEQISIEDIEDKIGIKPSFFPFNSVLALTLAKDHNVNPFVNSGAIATTSALCHIYDKQSWKTIHTFFNELAGLDGNEKLEHSKKASSTNMIKLDEKVFESEYENEQHNNAIANLLDSFGNLDASVKQTIKVYTKQCSVRVSSNHLATMGACLANGGIHPVTGKQLIEKSNVKYITSIMLSCGLYQESAKWSVYVGIPGKSGVGGGILMVVPGKYGIAVTSPPLNEAGNSYLGWEVSKLISSRLNLNIFDPVRQDDSHRDKTEKKRKRDKDTFETIHDTDTDTVSDIEDQ
jgi:glutaminase